jgi:effector-binding domain-containing protein
MPTRIAGDYMLDRPRLIQTDGQLTAIIHLTTPRAEIGQVMGPAIAEIISTLAAQGVTPAGPCYSYHPKRPSDTFDFEVGFPINRPTTPAGRVKMGRLPAANCVRTTYQGGYDGLAGAWSEFCAWIKTKEIKVQDGLWECYLAGPDTWRTELNRPLAV